METLKKNILAGKLSPVYFFHGPESYLKEEFTALTAVDDVPAFGVCQGLVPGEGP